MAMLGKRVTRGIIFFALSGLLSACGGGGGGGDDGATLPTTPTPTATVTQANATQVAAIAVSLNPGALTPTMPGIAAAGAPDLSAPLSERVQGHADKLRGLMRDMSGRVQPLVTQTLTNNCFIAGTMTVIVNYADPNVDTVGDSVSISYNQCDDGLGVYSGSVTLTLTALSGTPGFAPYTIGMAMSYNAFRHTIGVDYVEMAGGINLTDSDDGQATTSAISGRSMTMSYFFGGQLDVITLSSFNLSNSVDWMTWESTSSMTYTVNAAILGGTISVSTPLAFKTAAGAMYPYQGIMVVTGANNTKVKLTTIDAVNVQIEGDFDGDGTYEYLAVTTWAAL